MAEHRRPLHMTVEESIWYERTPKHEIYAIMRSFANRIIDDETEIAAPGTRFQEIKEERRLLDLNGCLPTSRGHIPVRDEDD